LTIAEEIIHASPTFAVLLFLGVLWATHRKDISRLLRRTDQLELFGFKVIASRALLSVSERAKNKGMQAISRRRQRVVLQKLEEAQDDLRNSEILWVDDHPYNCYDEGRVLQSFGVIVSFVTKTEEALEVLTDRSGSSQIDVIITDIDRLFRRCKGRVRTTGTNYGRADRCALDNIYRIARRKAP